MGNFRRKRKISEAIDVLRIASFREIQQHGYHFQANDFYTPLNDCAFLEQNGDLWRDPALSREIDWNLDRQMEVAKIVGRYVDELRDIVDSVVDKESGHFASMLVEDLRLSGLDIEM